MPYIYLIIIIEIAAASALIGVIVASWRNFPRRSVKPRRETPDQEWRVIWQAKERE